MFFRRRDVSCALLRLSEKPHSSERVEYEVIVSDVSCRSNVAYAICGKISVFTVSVFFCLFRHLFLHSYAFGGNRFPNVFSSRLFFTEFNKMNASKNTRSKVMALFKTYGNEGIFGRSDIATVTAASYSSAGELIVKLKDSGLIVEVKGHGKGKYRFSENKL